MVRKPDIFLMDEPLSNLDAKLRVTMRGELRRFHLDLNATTVYVTHDQLEAMTMSDLIAVMHKGVVQQFGTPEDVYKRPANLFVAGFIGSPPMNFLEGDVEGGRFKIGEAALPLPSLDSAKATGSAAVIGVRPQDLSLMTSAGPDALAGRVSLVELLGSEKLVEVQISDRKRISVQVRADSQVGLGENVHVGFDAQSIHVFDKQTEQSLLA